MASITNASNAYVSAGNGNAYSLMPKIYLASGYTINTGNCDAYIQYDSQGNFAIKGCAILNSPLYQFGYISYPDYIFGPPAPNNWSTFIPQFIQQPQITSVVDQNGNNLTSSFKLLSVYNTNGQLAIVASNNQIIPTGTYYFTVQGQAQLLQRLI